MKTKKLLSVLLTIMMMFTLMLGATTAFAATPDKNVSSIEGSNILLIGDYAFNLSDPANSNYTLNNFLVAAKTAYLNPTTGKYEVYFKIGDKWFDVVSDPTMATLIPDVSKINGDGLFNFTNMGETPAPVVDKTALTDAITAANTNKTTAVVSADGSDVLPANQWVLQADLDTYAAAITAAQAVVDNADATQTAVNDAVAALATATDTFNAAKKAGTLVPDLPPITGPLAEEYVKPLDFGYTSDIDAEQPGGQPAFNVGFQLQLAKLPYADITKIEASLVANGQTLVTRTATGAQLAQLQADDVFYGGEDGQLSVAFIQRDVPSVNAWWSSTPYDFTTPTKAVIKVTTTNHNTYIVENGSLLGDPLPVPVQPADLAAYNAALAVVVQADYTVASWGAYQAVVDAKVVTATNTQTEVDAATAAITAAQAALVKVAAAVADLAELKAALANTDITTINITADFDTAEKILVSRAVTINGGSKTITFTGNIAAWQGNYVIQVYNTTGVTIKDIKLIGADAALLVNNSSVTLTGAIDVSGNEFGGIESSGVAVANVSGATLTNGSEAYALPTLWEDGINGDTVTGFPGTKVTVSGQIHYYLTATNATAPVTP